MSKELVNTVTLWTAILAGAALLIAFPGVFVTAFVLFLIGAVLYGAWPKTNDDWRRQFENLVIGTIAGRIGRGKDIL